MTTTLTRTGKKVPFLDIHIGSPFFAHERLWVRTAFSAATELLGTPTRRGDIPKTCNFIIDGKAKPKFGPYSHEGERCEMVEVVAFIPGVLP